MFPPIFEILTDSGAVTAIVGDRIYGHNEAPQKATRPYVTWFLVSSVPENLLDEPPDIDRCSVQIDCWHQSGSGVRTLAEAVRGAVEQVSYVTEILFDQREAETNLFRVALQIDYFHQRGSNPRPARLDDKARKGLRPSRT
jgi:hypothetical protein